MFNRLFERSHALARQLSGPLVEERRRYLVHCADLGMATRTLRLTAQLLIAAEKYLKLAERPDALITLQEIEEEGTRWSSRKSLPPIRLHPKRLVENSETRRVAAPLYEAGRTLLHGITFGGHPLAAAIALKNLELFEREHVLDNVRDARAPSGRRCSSRSGGCRSSAMCAAAATSGRSSSCPTVLRAASTPSSERSCCGSCLPGALIRLS